MPFAKIKNLQIYYETHGAGEAIILLHHGFGCAKIWQNIYLRLMTQGYTVVMYDRRGYGQSDPGDDFYEFYESDRYRPESVEELVLLKEHLGIRACHLIGQCEGGVVAIDYAVKYPQEIKTLVTASTQCFSDTTMIELNALKFPKKYRDLEPEIRAKMISWHGEKNAETLYNQFGKQGGAYGVQFFDLRPILPLVTCPSLVLYPDRSSIFAVEQAVAFYRHLSKGELAVFPKCGHNTYEQRPLEYTQTILDFIKRNTTGGDLKTKPAMTCLA